jgi:hypothetical protein
MPYTVNFADSGKTPIIVNDGTVDTSTSVVLIGKNYNRFGEALNEDLLHLLENAANATPPSNPTEGQLWYDTENSQLMLFDNGRWYPIGFPAGANRVEVKRRLDTLGFFHYTIEHLVNDHIVTITVSDTTAWTPANSEFLEDGVTLLSTQYPVIQAGINMNTAENYKFRGTATSAEYADLAERYAADDVYEPGTVVILGGAKEITSSKEEASIEVFGIVSTAPGFEMNSAAGNDATHPFIALAGRVPCKVIGKINKGQRLVTSSVAGHARAAFASELGDYRRIIGRALTSKEIDGVGLVEVVVGAK